MPSASGIFELKKPRGAASRPQRAITKAKTEGKHRRFKTVRTAIPPEMEVVLLGAFFV